MSAPNLITGANKPTTHLPDWVLRAGFYGFVLAITGSMGFAWRVRDAHYLIPDAGLGYGLGITGCLLMLLLLVYPLRKRIEALQNWWSITGWFRMHMLLGVLGPCLILLHCNFSLGSTNSTVALIAMLLVAGSGLVGRYFYGKFHDGLYGEQLKLVQLHADFERLFKVLSALTQNVKEQEAVNELHKGCAQIIDSQQRGLSFHQLMQQRRWLHNRRKLVKHLDNNLGKELPELTQSWTDLSKLMETLAGLALFERLFGIWHVVHIPVFVLMVLTALVHIFVVHWY